MCSIIQTNSVTILFFDLIDYTNEHYSYTDIFIILILASTMTLSQTNDQLAKKRLPNRLISNSVLTSLVGQAIIQMSVYMLLAEASAFLILRLKAIKSLTH